MLELQLAPVLREALRLLEIGSYSPSLRHVIPKLRGTPNNIEDATINSFSQLQPLDCSLGPIRS